MIADPDRFARALARFDSCHAQDPRQQPDEHGRPQPKELLYAQRMTDRLLAFAPRAGEALQLAVRCQHLGRWTIPRDRYPRNRAGYLRWRRALAELHAQQAGDILRQEGYDEATVARVQSLVRKENLPTDPEAQTLEDVACLVFLEHELDQFAAQHDPDKVLSILRKTWRKMSPAARQAAAQLRLPPAAAALVERANLPTDS